MKTPSAWRGCGAQALLLAMALWSCAAPAATCNSTAGGNWNNAGIWSCGLVPGAGDDVTVSAGHTVSLNGADRNSRSFTIAGTGQLNDGGNDLTINNNGNVAINGTWSGGGGRLVKNGTGTLSGTGSLTGDARIDINGNTSILAGANLTFTDTVNGQIDIATGITVTNNGTVTVTHLTEDATSSVWTNAANSTLNVRDDLLAGGGTLNANAGGNTVNYMGAGNQTIKLPTGGDYFHLTLSGSGTKTIGTAAGQTVTIAGNLTVGTGVTYEGTTRNPVVNLAGTFTDNGTFNSGTGAFTFNGLAAQTITGTAGGTTTITDLRLNNANGLSLTGTHDVTVALGVTLTNGRITTGANILYISSGLGIGGAGATRFIVGNLRKRVSAGTNVGRQFEVGTVTPAVRYAPVNNVRFGNVTVAGDFTVSTTINDHPNLDSSTLDRTQSVNRYWTLTNNSVTFDPHANNRVRFNFVAADLDGAATPGNFFVARYAGALWLEHTPTTRNATNTQITGAGITAANVSGEYAIAERLAAINPPGSFNAFETTTTPDPGAITGNVYTKLVGANFTVDVVAILSGVQHSSFNNTVQVDLVTGAAGGANCPGAPATVAGTTQSVALTTGRGTTASLNVATAVRDARVRVRYPVVGPTVTSCSTDNFSIRPTGFTVTSTNATQTGTSGGPTIKTGADFNLTAASVAGYDGTPTIDQTKIVGTPTAGAIGGSFGAAPAGTGTATGASFFYNEVGNFGLNANAVFDSTFTSVDQGTGDCTADFSNSLVGGKYGCSFGSTAIAQTTGSSGFGRFIPDNFDVSVSTAPVLGTTCGTFTYVGSSFAYTITPVMTVTARSGTSNGLTNTTTTNYAGAYMKLSNAAGTSLNQAPFDTQGGRYSRFDALGGGATPGLDANSGMPAVASDPTIGTFTNGVGTLTFGAGAGLSFTRAAPVAPFDADISLALNVIDTDGVAYASNPARAGQASAGNGIAFNNGKAARFGRLAIASRRGAPEALLALPMETQHWNGSAFVTNTLDSCTTVTAANLGLANYAGNLASGETTPAITTGTFSAGRNSISLSAPGAGNNGSVDVALNLGPTASTAIASCAPLVPAPSVPGSNLAHLRGQWCGATYTKDPAARATFGIFLGSDEVIFQRENF